jgi:hypothetical protein
MISYAPDGAWGEGPGYRDYATTYNVTMVAALESDRKRTVRRSQPVGP